MARKERMIIHTFQLQSEMSANIYTHIHLYPHIPFDIECFYDYIYKEIIVK